MHTIRVIALMALVALVAPASAHAQWTHVTSGTTAEFRGLSVVSDLVVWASGARGTVARSTDGGRTWTADTVPGAAALDFRSVHALDDRVAFIASAGEAEKGLAKIFSTHDGGTSWALAYASDATGVFFDAIVFWDERNGIALSDPVNGRFFLPITRDGGATWIRDSIRDPHAIAGEAAFAASGSSLAVNGASTVWIGTGGGGIARVLRSPDKGRTWIGATAPVHAQGAASGIFALAFFDRRNGVAVGGDYTQPTLAASSVAITRDGGRSWRRAKAPPAAYLSGVAFAGSATKLVALGLAGTFVSDDRGERWRRIDSIPMNAVRFKGRAGWAVGPRGRIARWTP